MPRGWCKRQNDWLCNWIHPRFSPARIRTCGKSKRRAHFLACGNPLLSSLKGQNRPGRSCSARNGKHSPTPLADTHLCGPLCGTFRCNRDWRRRVAVSPQSSAQRWEDWVRGEHPARLRPRSVVRYAATPPVGPLAHAAYRPGNRGSSRTGTTQSACFARITSSAEATPGCSQAPRLGSPHHLPPVVAPRPTRLGANTGNGSLSLAAPPGPSQAAAATRAMMGGDFSGSRSAYEEPHRGRLRARWPVLSSECRLERGCTA